MGYHNNTEPKTQRTKRKAKVKMKSSNTFKKYSNIPFEFYWNQGINEKHLLGLHSLDNIQSDFSESEEKRQI